MIHFTKEGGRKKVGLNLYRTRGGFVVAWVWYYPETHELKGWRFRLRMHMRPRILWSVDSCQEPTYTSTQATNCAGCGEHKHTPLRIDSMGGYVCLTCIDKKLGSLLGEFGYEQPEQYPQIAISPEIVGYVAPQRTWVDLTRAQFAEILCDDRWQGRPELMMLQVQAKLKEKNT